MAAAEVLRVVEREALVFRRTWHGTVFSGIVTPVLFLGAIGIGLGGLIDERTGTVEGLSYLDFVTPGLLAAGAVQTSAGMSLWPVMMGTKWMRFFHGMVATTMSPADVYGGTLLWNVIRTGMYAAAFLAVAAAMGGVDSFWGVLAVPAAALGAMALAAPLMAFAATQETDVAFSLVMRLLVMPLFLFSGTFFPVEELPDALEGLAVLSPVWHAAEVARGAMTGTLVAADVGHVAVLAGFVAAGWAWGTRTFARKLVP